MELITRFFRGSESSFFLFGPRGTGKSSWLVKNKPEALLIDLLKDEEFKKYSAKPERLREVVKGNPAIRTFIIDEIQKVPSLLDTVHFLIEKNKHIQFVLTGSSARKLKRAGTNLLAGRALLTRMHPFMASELGSGFDLDRALELGMLPIVLDSRDPEATLSAYIGLYLREEVQMEGIIRNIGNFSRFLEALSFSHGSVLNVSNISRECSVERKTVESYISVAEDLLIAHKLPVFQRKSKRRLSVHPKFYFFDTGVFRSLRPMGSLDEPQMIHGQSLEGLVFQHLKAWVDYRPAGETLSYWRTRDGTEVDFIVYGKDEFRAIEVKNTGTVRPKDLRPLTSFLHDYPMCKAMFLYRGNEALKRNDILCLPVTKFLEHLHPEKPLP